MTALRFQTSDIPGLPSGELCAAKYVLLCAAKYIFRSKTVENSTIEEVVGSFPGPAQVRFCSSICDLVVNLVRGAGVEGAWVAERPLHPCPPWLMERAEVVWIWGD